MPRKKKPGAKAQAPKNQPKKPQPKKKNQPRPAPKHPYSRPSFGLPWFEKQQKAAQNKPVKPPTGTADGGGTPEPLKPVDALAEWRAAHPVTPPTFTGEWAGDLGGGPQQTAPGAPPKHNGAPLYSVPTPNPATPTTPVAPERVSWGELLASYMGDMRQSQLAGWVYSPGTIAPPPQPAATALPMRPDIDPETVQMMMRKVSSGYVGGA